MPVQYIIGEWDFRDITLKLVPPVFIPRPETEMLVHYVLKALNTSENKKPEILEIGCGSGAVTLSIAHTNASVIIVASLLTLWRKFNYLCSKCFRPMNSLMRFKGKTTF